MTRAYQTDLFAHLAPTVHWTQADRQQAMLLLRELLQEAISDPGMPNRPLIGKEAGDDQDHG